MAMVVQFCEYTEKPLNFIVCELYISEFLKQGGECADYEVRSEDPR